MQLHLKSISSILDSSSEGKKGLVFLLSGNEPNARNLAHQVQDLETTERKSHVIYLTKTSVAEDL